ERQTGLPVSGHHAFALLERERGRLAGGAEHVQSIASVGEKKARKRDRARAIGLAPLVHGSGDRRNHPSQFAGHSLSPKSSVFIGYGLPDHPLTLNAASAAILTSWASLADSPTICTGRSSPTRIGPITVAPPNSCRSLVEIEAE